MEHTYEINIEGIDIFVKEFDKFNNDMMKYLWKFKGEEYTILVDTKTPPTAGQPLRWGNKRITLGGRTGIYIYNKMTCYSTKTNISGKELYDMVIGYNNLKSNKLLPDKLPHEVDYVLNRLGHEIVALEVTETDGVAYLKLDDVVEILKSVAV